MADGTIDGADEVVGGLQPWIGCESELTVGCLMSPVWLRQPELRNTYLDAATYWEALQRLVTLLTFYWGAGAISPRYRHTQPGDGESKQCNELLLMLCPAGRRCTARQHTGGACNAPAMVGCPWGSHTDSLCVRCLWRGQLSLLAKPQHPKSHASTEVYNAIINPEQVRREGLSTCSPSSSPAGRRRSSPTGA